MKAEVEVLSPGLYSSIQDMGRTGYMKYGVPLSGGMDSYSVKLANLYLRNSIDAAVLEITLSGPVLRFSHPTEIIVTGADLSPQLNDQEILNFHKYQVAAGDTLSFGKRKTGCRACLAVAGGFQTPEVLGSRSWYEGISEAFRLQKGMKLPYEEREVVAETTHTSLKEEEEHLSSNSVEVLPGPEFHLLTEEQRTNLLFQTFSLDHNNNRMAIQLQEPLENELEPIITGPVVPGTVQLTPSGKLIVLMRDCQTTGGYPRVLQLSEKGINTIAQKITGEGIAFHLQESHSK